MRLHRSCRLRWSVLALPAALVVAGTVAAANPAIARDPVDVRIMTAPFGTGTHAMYAGFASAVNEKHPWVRIQAVETPGWVYNSTEMANNENIRADTVTTLSPAALWTASLGMRPWREPTEPEGWRSLFAYMVVVSYFVTFDESIQTPQDLAQARIGLGRATQTHWAIFPTIFLERGHGLELRRVDRLGPGEAMRALMDGAVDAAIITEFVPFDFSLRRAPGPMLELEGSGRRFHIVPFATHDAVHKLHEEMGAPFLAATMPGGMLPGRDEPVETYGDPTNAYVHEDFPEDVAYELTAFLIENWERLSDYHAGWATANPSTWIAGHTTATLHPGAVRAYREAGIDVPEG